MVIITHYSAALEPVTNLLQGVDMDLLKCADHVQRLLQLVCQDRSQADDRFRKIFTFAKDIAKRLNIDLQAPRTVGRQAHRVNVDASSPEEYFRRTIFIPYLDSLATSLEERFNDSKKAAFLLFKLVPNVAGLLSSKELHKHVTDIQAKFKFPNLEIEAELWRRHWKDQDFRGNLCDAIHEARHFYLWVEEALTISATL